MKVNTDNGTNFLQIFQIAIKKLTNNNSMTINYQSSAKALSIASFKFFSKSFFASEKPCFVFPKELGPDEVGVSLEQIFK